MAPYEFDTMNHDFTGRLARRFVDFAFAEGFELHAIFSHVDDRSCPRISTYLEKGMAILSSLHSTTRLTSKMRVQTNRLCLEMSGENISFAIKQDTSEDELHSVIHG